MTYYELIMDAVHKLNFNQITCGEYEEMIKPLKREIEEQPCEDCISRQAVLDKKNLVELDDGQSFYCINPKDIETLPTVTPQQTRWIPVSERLPMEYEFVNCTCHSLIDDREDWVIETVYIPQPLDSPYSDWGNIPMLNSGECKVVAWMHRDIPKPYYAESEKAVSLTDIMSLPSVQPQPKTGHWIFDEILDKHYYCSECKSMGVDYWDFCPYCGAKMEVE